MKYISLRKQSLVMILISIAIMVALIACLIASYTDLKKGIIPFKLTLPLIVVGIIINIVYSILNQNLLYFCFTIASPIITFIVAYLLWYFHIWGGGDALLITSLSALVPLQVIISGFNGIYITNGLLPFSFIIIINSIIIAVPVIIGMLFKNHIKNILNSDVFSSLNFLRFSFFNFIFFIFRSCENLVSLNDLEEGMILGNYYFNDELLFKQISLFNSSEIEDYNIKIIEKKGVLSSKFYPDFSYNNFNYCLMSKSTKGLTKDDINLLHHLYNRNLLSKNVFIKMAIPFGPFICLGFIFSLFYGNLVYVLGALF